MTMTWTAWVRLAETLVCPWVVVTTMVSNIPMGRVATGISLGKKFDLTYLKHIQTCLKRRSKAVKIVTYKLDNNGPLQIFKSIFSSSAE